MQTSIGAMLPLSVLVPWKQRASLKEPRATRHTGWGVGGQMGWQESPRFLYPTRRAEGLFSHDCNRDKGHSPAT